jgi:hypothetical protein
MPNLRDTIFSKYSIRTNLPAISWKEERFYNDKEYNFLVGIYSTSGKPGFYVFTGKYILNFDNITEINLVYSFERYDKDLLLWLYRNIWMQLSDRRANHISSYFTFKEIPHVS